MSVSPLPNRQQVLAGLPLFSGFEPAELEAVAERLIEVTYHRGDTICAEGEEGGTFYVCLSGELEVWAGSPRRIVNRLGPGDWFGEMALLLGTPRVATVKAVRNTRLLALDKPVFDTFFCGNPKVLTYVSRVLSKRIATLNRGQPVPQATTIVAVTGGAGLRGKTLVARSLARLLHEFSVDDAVVVELTRAGEAPALVDLAATSVDAVRRHLVHVDGPVPPMLTVGLPEHASAAALSEALCALAVRLGDAFPWIVLDAGEADGDLDAAIRDAADVLVRLVDAFDPLRGGAGAHDLPTHHVVNLHNPTSPVIPINHCEPFVVRDDAALRGLPLADAVEYLVAHPRSDAAAALHRLARKLLHKTVGIALGGGAAFGMAHLGVLSVLEENCIPIDMVVGCSMGSLGAIGYAAGMSAAELIRIAREMGTLRNVLSVLLDVTLTRPAFLSGDRVVQLLLPLVAPKKSFEELLLPCRVVATDIESGERVSIGTGSFEACGRASCAIPMVFSPVRYQGRILVDGGVCDPVPAEVLTEMGADVTIAVNAVPHLRKGVETGLSRWYRRLKRLDPFSYLTGSGDLPNMFDITMNAIQTLQHELGKFKAISADVQIAPDLAAYTWVEFYRPQEFIDRGIEAAERALPAIRRVLAARGTPRRASCEPAAGASVKLQES